MESQPQNPEFRNNPENFHPCKFQFNQINRPGVRCRLKNFKMAAMVPS